MYKTLRRGINLLEVFDTQFITKYYFSVNTPSLSTTSTVAPHILYPSYTLKEDYDTTPTIRFTNPLVLRPTAKNSIVTYNALQKVFRTRIEEGRSLATLEDFIGLKADQPFFNAPRVSYEKLIGKNRTNFYNSILYNTKPLYLYNNNFSLPQSLNFYYFDFPFLLSVITDSSRYVWFD